MERQSDNALIELCLSGHKEAFNVLVIRYQKQIFALAYRLCGDYDEAKDLAQESFIHIYSRLASFDLERPFFPWMYRVAHNICLNKLNRGASVAVSYDEAEDFLLQEDRIEHLPDRALDKKENAQQVYRAIEKLPDQYREVVVLKYIQGFSYKEISRSLDLPESTIETRLFRARRALQKTLAPLVTKK